MAHTYSASSLGYEGRPVGNGGDPTTWQLLAKFNRYIYGKVARLMQRLDENGILDSTLILASSDMGNPAAHSTRNVPRCSPEASTARSRWADASSSAPIARSTRTATRRAATTRPNRTTVCSPRSRKRSAWPVDDYGRQASYPTASGTLPGL